MMDFLSMDEGLEADDALEIVVAVLKKHGVSPFLDPSEGDEVKPEVESLAADLVTAHRLRSDKPSSHRHLASIHDRARAHRRRVELLTELLESYENELQHELKPRPGRDGTDEPPDLSEKEERRLWRLLWLRDELPDLRERQKRIRWLRETLAEEQATVDRIGAPPPHPNKAPGRATIEVAFSMVNVLTGSLYPGQGPIEDSMSRVARIIADMYVRAGVDQRPVEKVEASLYQAVRNASS